jgi:hypothetical protein
MPIVNAMKRGIKLALLMLFGAATGSIFGIAGLFRHRVSTGSAGIVDAEDAFMNALIGAGGGVLAFHLLIPIIGPPFARLNARMQADTWSTPKSSG